MAMSARGLDIAILVLPRTPHQLKISRLVRFTSFHHCGDSVQARPEAHQKVWLKQKKTLESEN